MTDYMTRKSELEKHPKAMHVFQQIANGDVAVFKLLKSFWNFEHVIDDLLDKGKPEDQETKALMFKALAEFVDTLLTNPFVKTYADDLRAMLVSVIMRGLAGDRFKEKQSPLAAAISCGDIDFIMHIAYLHRGWDFQQTIEWARVYDQPDEVEVVK